MTANANTQTHVRAPGTAPQRIEKLGRKLERNRGGRWPQAAVVDEALKALEEKESKPKAEAA